MNLWVELQPLNATSTFLMVPLLTGLQRGYASDF
jgi:hypothetical protein